MFSATLFKTKCEIEIAFHKTHSLSIKIEHSLDQQPVGQGLRLSDEFDHEYTAAFNARIKTKTLIIYRSGRNSVSTRLTSILGS